MIELVIIKVNKKAKCLFTSKMICNTVTEAYQHYVKHFATLGEKLYYLRTAHQRLNKVTDEKTMEAIFRNVFSYAFIRKIKPKGDK